MLNKAMNLATLLEKNQVYIEQYKNNELMKLIQSIEMNEAENRVRLLDCIQVFSNYFQKTVMLRSILTENNRFLKVAQEHLEEEFGHDLTLNHDRHDRRPTWDPILEACSCWFTWKMLVLDNYGKTFLVHLVLESSANIFFKEAHLVMKRHAETNYFQMHAVVDEHHEQMGIQLLEGLSAVDYERLLEIQQQGWDMLNMVCTRMAELSVL